MGDVARPAERDADDERRARDDRWRDQRLDERAFIVRFDIDRDVGREGRRRTRRVD